MALLFWGGESRKGLRFRDSRSTFEPKGREGTPGMTIPMRTFHNNINILITITIIITTTIIHIIVIIIVRRRRIVTAIYDIDDVSLSV